MPVQKQYNKFTGNLDGNNNILMFFIIKEAKETIKDFSQGTVKTNLADDSNDENNFPHKFLLTNTEVSKLRKAFANNSSANIKLSKAQLHKVGQSGGFLSRLLGPLLKTGLLLIVNVLKPLAKSFLIPLG